MGTFCRRRQYIHSGENKWLRVTIYVPLVSAWMCVGVTIYVATTLFSADLVCCWYFLCLKQYSQFQIIFNWYNQVYMYQVNIRAKWGMKLNFEGYNETILLWYIIRFPWLLCSDKIFRAKCAKSYSNHIVRPSLRQSVPPNLSVNTFVVTL